MTLEGSRRPVLIFSTLSIFSKPGQPGQPGNIPEYLEENNEFSCPDFPTGDPKPGHKTGTPDPGNGESVPVSFSGFSDGAPKPGQETAAKTHEKSTSVPTVPIVPVSRKEEGSGKSKRHFRNNDRTGRDD
jgi:hypothetical protein